VVGPTRRRVVGAKAGILLPFGGSMEALRGGAGRGREAPLVLAYLYGCAQTLRQPLGSEGPHFAIRFGQTRCILNMPRPPALSARRSGPAGNLLQAELLQEKAANLGRLARRLERALDALESHDGESTPSADGSGRAGGANCWRTPERRCFYT
jgi:hypothetical protein